MTPNVNPPLLAAAIVTAGAGAANVKPPLLAAVFAVAVAGAANVNVLGGGFGTSVLGATPNVN